MSYLVKASGGVLIPLGYHGENLARSIDFSPITDKWMAHYGRGEVHLLAQRKGDPAPYPVALDGVIWHISEADNAVPGNGKCELVYTIDNRRVVSEVWTTVTIQSLLGDAIDPPEPQESWVARVLDAADRADDAADRADAAAVHQPIINGGTWWVWSQPEERYVDTGEQVRGNVMFATFDVNPQTGKLIVTTPDEYAGPVFSISDSGHLEVTINGSN